MKKNIIVIIEGPSGVGKDTIINELISRYPGRFRKVISTTTRPIRENESQGNPYFFLTEDEFKRRLEVGDIFEHTIRHGTYRGMTKSGFDEILSNNMIALKDCDRFGLDAVKKVYGNDSVLSIFLTADKEKIRSRLIERGEPKESMESRLKDFDTYIQNSVYFDNIIENNDINETIEKILNLINKFDNR